MEAIKNKVTGGAYDKPAKTVDGAMTTQDSADAHTIEGTTADPNAQGSAGLYEKGEQMGDKAKDAGYQAEEKVKEGASKAQEKAPPAVKDKAPPEVKDKVDDVAK